MDKETFFLSIYNATIKPLEGYGLRKYKILRQAKTFVRSHANLDLVEVQGHKMYIDDFDCMNLSKKGVHEPIETDFVKKNVTEGSIVLDIGANIGYYTLLLAKLVGEKGKVYSFEPEPYNFNLLKKNVETNGYENIILENAAVSNTGGKSKLFLSKGRSTHSLFTFKNKTENSIDVNLIKLDEYFNNNPLSNKISFVKLDVEGSELAAIQGMKSILEKNKQILLMIEFNARSLREAEVIPVDLINFLKKYQFKISYKNNKTNKIEKVENTDILLEKYDNEKADPVFKYTNLFCRRY